MPRARRKSKMRRREKPAPLRDHRTECRIIASRAAARGLLQLLAALDDEQSIDHDRVGERTDRATAEFDEALRWTRISKEPVTLLRRLGGGDS